MKKELLIIFLILMLLIGAGSMQVTNFQDQYDIGTAGIMADRYLATSDNNRDNPDESDKLKASQFKPMISSGRSHSLDLKDEDEIWNWWINHIDRLGDEATGDNHNPVQSWINLSEEETPGSDANLSDLEVEPGTLAPEFAAETTAYKIDVDHKIEQVNVTATLSDENASLEIDSNSAKSGEAATVNLNEPGTTTIIEVVVTAKDSKTEKIYAIIVNQVEEGVIQLPDHLYAEKDQIWRINFNREFTKNEVEDIYIDEVVLMTTLTNDMEEFIAVDVKWLPEDKQAIITPKENYIPGETYYLRIDLSNGNRYRMKFTVVLGEIILVPEKHETIQAGIEVAQDGDTILVAPGTYPENIDFLGKNIAVVSEAGPKETIIDGKRKGSVVTFHKEENGKAILHGFTLTNGLAYGDPELDDIPFPSGGGIAIVDASPTISHLIIHNNATSLFGGGIYVEGEQAKPLIEKNIIRSNMAQYQGGGMEIRRGAEPVVRGNIITGNLAEACGGIKVADQSSPLIEANAIYANESGYDFCPEHVENFLDGKSVDEMEGIIGHAPVFPSGILVVQHSSPVIQNNEIFGNDGGGIGVMLESFPVIENNLIKCNSNVNVGAITGGVLVALDSAPVIRDNSIGFNEGPEVWIDDTSLINQKRERSEIEGENDITGDVFLWPLPRDKDAPISEETLEVPGEYKTIQEAIEAAEVGDEVIVAKGTYKENIDFLGKDIHLRSEGPYNEAVVASTVIEARNPGATVSFIRGESEAAIIEGFTIKNQAEKEWYTAGIRLSSSSPTIVRNIITGSVGPGIKLNYPHTPLYIFEEPANGGQNDQAFGLETAPLIKDNIFEGNQESAIFSYYASPTVTGNLFKNNNSGFIGGGGFMGWFSHPLITGNEFIGNSTESLGGAIYFENFSFPVVSNNIIKDNSAQWLGGGIYFDSPSYAVIDSNYIEGNKAMPGSGIAINFGAHPRITNNVIANNIGEAMYVGGSSHPGVINNTFADNFKYDGHPVGIFPMDNSRVKIINTIFYNSNFQEGDIFSEINMTYSLLYDGTSQSWPGEGNIFADPLFVDAGDYRLSPGSPAIEAGTAVDLDKDLEGNKRPHGESFDIGAYEFVE